MLLRDRLTKKSGDYCLDECGQTGTCPRLDHARRHNDLSLRCGDALRYDWPGEQKAPTEAGMGGKYS